MSRPPFRHLMSLARLCLWTLPVWLASDATWAGTTSDPVKSAHITWQAFSDREAIIPGQPITLAVVAKMETDWHIYWESPGPGGGLPTKINWSLPPGFELGRTQYPSPEIAQDPVLKLDTYALKEEAIFLTAIRPPADAQPGQNVELTADIKFLACHQECIPGKATLKLELPIASSGAAAEANADLFEKARRLLSIPPAKAQYLKLSAKLEPSVAKPGETVHVLLDIAIEKGHHMQAHKPHQDFLIPAEVFAVIPDGFEIGEIEYPQPHDRDDPSGEKFSEYSGNIQIKIPLAAAEDAGTDPRWARGVLQNQICNDEGTCYPPQYIEWAVPIQMEGGAPPKPEPEWVTTGGATDSPAKVTRKSKAHGWLVRTQDYFLQLGYFGVIFLAFVGGLIINLMPCVLPVISLKVLSFVRQAQEDRRRIFALGMSYCLGIMIFFSFIAGLFLWRGTRWGQLFQQPHIVLGLAGVVLAFALSLFGVFAVFTPRVINVLAEKAEGEGLFSAFSTGVLATFLGTACTAPFLSAAVGAASRFPGPQGAGIFMAVGFGMAFPFFFLSAKPGWLRHIPKPGPWMGTFEAVMGFLLLGTVIWLLSPLRGQIGDYGLLLSLIFLLAVAIAAWIKGRIQFGDPPSRKVILTFLAVVFLVLGWLIPFRWMSTIPNLVARQIEHGLLIADGQLLAQSGLKSTLALRPPKWPEREREIPWQRYDRAMALRAVREGYTVFVDYTADWCANCKTMLKLAIEQPSVIKTMKELRVIPLTADYTLELPEIKEDLDRFNRGGVPVFVVYSPGNPDEPELLPEVITSEMLVDALKRAGPSKASE